MEQPVQSAVCKYAGLKIPAHTSDIVTELMTFFISFASALLDPNLFTKLIVLSNSRF